MRTWRDGANIGGVNRCAVCWIVQGSGPAEENGDLGTQRDSEREKRPEARGERGLSLLPWAMGILKSANETQVEPAVCLTKKKDLLPPDISRATVEGG